MTAIGGYDNDDVVIKGLDTNGDTVPVNIVTGPNGTGFLLQKAARPIHAMACLLNGGSPDLTVDGSSTPVEFTQAPPAGQIWHVHNVGIAIEDNGTNASDRFGAILNGLTNGLQFLQKQDGTEYEYINLKNNFDLANAFTQASHFVGVGSGFINNPNLFTGSVNLEPELKLVGDDGDKLIAKVRDNLTGIDNLKVRMSYWRDLG